MNTGFRFALFQAIIILPFIAGSVLRPRLSDPSALAKKLLRVNILVLDPMVILWSVWGLSFSMQYMFLPAAGLILVLGGFVLGRGFSPLAAADGRRRSIFTISSSLANHGFTMGGFLCYTFMGEKGLGLSSLFLLYFTPYTFLFIFPYARAASRQSEAGGFSLRENLLTTRNMPLFASLLGLFLTVRGIPRPFVHFPVDALLLMSIGLYYLTLGINFTPGNILAARREHLFLALIKFIILPCITAVVLYLLPLERESSNVILLQSCMPAAIYSVVSAVLFDLDPEAASSMFVINTILFIIAILPLLFLIFPVVA